MDQNKQTKINRNIRAQTVLLIDQDGKNVGTMATSKALEMALESGFDLVEVSSGKEIPVCRIMDYGKWRYEQSKRDRKNKNQHKSQGAKEIKFRPNTGINDLSYRAKRFDEFISDGYRVKLSVRFKGREIEHMYSTGKDLLERFLSLAKSNYKILGSAVVEGRNIALWAGPNDE